MQAVYCRRLTIDDMELILRMNQTFREGMICCKNAEVFLKNPRNWLYAAVCTEEIVGFAYGYALERLDSKGNMLYINEVGVAESFQRQGIGFHMMECLMQCCREEGITRCFLAAHQNNPGANALYRKLGGEVSPDSLGQDTCYYFRL